MIIYSIGPSSRPFEPARGKDARREEDEFMELHASAACRNGCCAVPRKARMALPFRAEPGRRRM